MECISLIYRDNANHGFTPTRQRMGQEEIWTTRRHYFTPIQIRCRLIMQTQILSHEGKGHPLRIVGENVKWCSCFGKQYGGSTKKLKIKMSYDLPSYSTLGGMPKGIGGRSLNRNVYTHVPHSRSHMAQKAKITQMSADAQRGKQNVVYTYNGILFSLKRRKSWPLL